MQDIIELIHGKNVLVFGVGRQGGGSGDAAWLAAHGANVRLSDKDLTLAPEGQTREQIDWADIVIKNPGVSDTHELILYGRSKDIPVYTSIALFVKYSSLTTIGVTGTRGKSTTVALISQLLETAYPGQIVVGGNIPGTSGLSLFDQQDAKKYAVLELSSFQLHNFHDLQVSPDLAIVTNLYPDHLNRYETMEEYQRDKAAICVYQSQDEHCFYNQDNPGAKQITASSPGHLIRYSAQDISDWETPLPGIHNRENIAAMARLALHLGIDIQLARRVVKDFRGVPSRQEKVAEVNDVVYINDTTSTTPVAALFALKAATAPTIWITGGDSKNLPFDELLAEVKVNDHIKHIIILGSKNIPDYLSALTELVGDKILGQVDSMSEAVNLAKNHADPGDRVLLSPGFASFDLFKNEFDRGDQFNRLVQAL